MPIRYRRTTPPPVDVYVADHSATFVSRVVANTGVVMPFPGDGYANGLAVDGLGNVFLAGVVNPDWGVIKVPPSGGPHRVLAPGLLTHSVAVDRSGGVYTMGAPADDTGSYRALKMRSDGSPPTVLWTSNYPDSGQLPWAIDVDDVANVYILLFYPVTVVRIPADGGPPTTITLAGIIPTENPWSFAVSPSGQHVYLADIYTSRIAKVPLNGGPYTYFGANLNDPFGIDVDGADNVYIADTRNDRVVMIFGDSGRQVTICRTLSPSAAAVQPIRIPRWRPPDLVGRLLGAAAVDGGGWFVVGDHIVRIPPRSPVLWSMARAAAPYLDQAIENPEIGRQLRNLR
jgi:DNA-binding beta-propeller fold protein YncE